MTADTNHAAIDAIGTSVSLCPTADSLYTRFTPVWTQLDPMHFVPIHDDEAWAKTPYAYFAFVLYDVRTLRRDIELSQ